MQFGLSFLWTRSAFRVRLVISLTFCSVVRPCSDYLVTMPPRRDQSAFSAAQTAELQALITSSLSAVLPQLAVARVGVADPAPVSATPPVLAEPEPAVSLLDSSAVGVQEEPVPTLPASFAPAVRRPPVSQSAPGVSGATASLSPPAPATSSVTSSSLTAPGASTSARPHLPKSGKPSRSVDVYSHVALAQIAKVLRGDFIDLSCLLPLVIASTPTAEPHPKRIRVSEEDGDLVMTASSSSRLRIASLQSWLEAWTIYCCIVANQQPSKSSELLGYQLIVLQSAKKFRWAAVADYDTQFRQRASRCSEVLWNKTDMDLYAHCFTGQSLPICSACHRPGHLAASCLSSPRGRQPQSAARPCDAFNRGRCNFRSCRFRHVCSSCGAGDHPRSQCTASSKST